MCSERGDPVTVHVVNEMWVAALEGSTTADEVHSRVERLLERVNAESPVVNWGMTRLRGLTRSSSASTDEFTEARIAWLAEVERYEADREGWMRRYFLDMVGAHTTNHGVEKGRAFATKLVRAGNLHERDLPPELRT